VNTNPADGCALNLNAKFHCRPFAYGSLQEFVRVLDGVRMREKVAYLQPDFAIVRMPCKRFSIVQSPRANGASFEHELHRSLAIEFNTRFLHLAIGH
jgi:hypothetical protein